MEDMQMAWTAPKVEEICLGMEINMYFPADERTDESEDGLFKTRVTVRGADAPQRLDHEVR
jgi:coenzyme PQQ precursor peptide PqqA